MVKINYWSIFILFLMACSNPKAISKKELISPDEMVIILTKRQLIVSEFNTFQYQGDFSQANIDSLLGLCHKELGYSDKDFENSWEFYTSSANDELMEIYDNVLQELQLLQEQSRN